MEITVHSNLPFVQGQVTVATDPNQSVDSLIFAFCIEKGIQHKKEFYLRRENEDILLSTNRVSSTGIQNGEVVFLCQREVSKMCCKFCNQWWLLAAVMLLIGGVGIIAVTVMKVVPTQPYEYGVVIDAGSSHTQVYVYSWKGQKQNDTAIVAEKYSCRADGGGISNYTTDPQQAGESIKHCLNEAVEYIPGDEIKSTPIFLGATAGMRLLRAADNKTSEAIMDATRNVIKTYPFNFTYPDLQARIIDGVEEGAFSWVTANYLSGIFLQGGGISDRLMSLWTGSQTTTYGALDLGGASTQVTFVPEDPALLNPEDEENLVLYGHTYRVYTHSYLCYGVNEAYRQYQAKLVKDQNASTVNDPCLASGWQVEETHADVFEVPCTKKTNSLSDLTLKQETTYQFNGTSNSTGCQIAVKKIFNFSDECDNCTFNGVQMPSIHGDYLAFSGFFYTMDFLNLTEQNSSLDDFRKKRDVFCSMSSEEISHTYKHPKDVEKYCFEAHYIYTLLVDAYKFNDTNWEKIQFKKQINNADLGWTVGLMLNVSNILPAEYPAPRISTVLFTLLIVLFVAFIFIAIGFACYAKNAKRKDKYQKLSNYGSI